MPVGPIIFLVGYFIVVGGLCWIAAYTGPAPAIEDKEVK